MKTLSIDTSSNICSIAILDDNNIIYEDFISDKLTHSENLMPMVQKAFDSLPFNLSDIDLYACSKGPGSFTGIRIGVATICAFRDFYNKPAIGISSLEGLAYNISSENNSLVCSIIDAKNDNVYAGLFKYEGNHYSLIGKYMSDNINNVLEAIKNYSDDEITFVGSGSKLFAELIKNNFNNCTIAKDEANNSSAASIAKAAIYKHFNCNSKEELSLSPLYLKKSSAEIELEKKLKEN